MFFPLTNIQNAVEIFLFRRREGKQNKMLTSFSQDMSRVPEFRWHVPVCFLGKKQNEKKSEMKIVFEMRKGKGRQPHGDR